MNSDLSNLQPYPFERIAQLKAGITPPDDLSMISLSIGEPKHPCPDIITSAITENLSQFENYPMTKGTVELRTTIANWLQNRFNLPAGSIDEDKHVLPVNGTREALFAFAQCVVDRTQHHAKVLMPNPFYQIYEGAAILAGAEPIFLPCTEETGYSPDYTAVPTATWNNCQLLYLCTPGNPTGSVASLDALKQILELAEKHNFIVASDECYSELYFDEDAPPAGLLQAAAEMGNTEYKRCAVFHSLSKRSNAPGLRSGFVAGDADILKQFLLYRTYHGCAMSLPVQKASIVAWNDEEHVRENRVQYRRKFDAVLDILDPVMKVSRPAASFYLWPETPQDDETFTQEIYRLQYINVVPGSYLARTVDGLNPGQSRIRMALVAPVEECVEAAHRIRTYLETR
ncbi:MAG: N-succinyl-L,L-diaminopimelate aminotransferase alternative (EC [uncultured Thiotrichaceae bacterium]|uniref:N-succinyl-L,L-diaminopimelate aminotransferase alternative (EC) n=1 Tax=uncultured Thiotrichaceae bacterium TaxID=298394 RepID=A0A6S6T682_9GAMM|nr:MAG: N-succinyl-L,L-diaminopimelate aminotransferase alternative (EC [uncultured Thiotrichaceae bacterium]